MQTTGQKPDRKVKLSRINMLAAAGTLIAVSLLGLVAIVAFASKGSVIGIIIVTVVVIICAILFHLSIVRARVGTPLAEIHPLTSASQYTPMLAERSSSVRTEELPPHEVLHAYLVTLVERYKFWREHYTPLTLTADVIVEQDLIPAPFTPAGFSILEERGYGPKATLESVRFDSLEKLSVQYQKLVILGLPGSGKTTALWELARIYATGNLQGTASKDWIPIFVDLAEFTSDISVQQLICAAVGPLSTYVENLLHKGKLVLLFDALDEIPRNEHYADKVLSLRGLVESFPANKYIFSCRTFNYDLSLGIPQARVEEMNRDQITTFVTKYLGPSGVGFLSQLDAEILDLARNPYNLLMMVQVYKMAGGTLPKQRSQLLDLFIQTLLRREKGRHASILAAEPQEIVGYLASLAYKGQEELAGATVFPQSWYVETMKSLAPGIDHGELLEICESADLIKVSQDGSTIGFPHHSLQEFLTAVEINHRFDQSETSEEVWQVDWLNQPLAPFERTPTMQYEPLPPPTVTHWAQPCITAASIRDNATRFVDKVADVDPILAGRCLTEGMAAVQPQAISKVTTKLTDIIEDGNIDVRVRVFAGDILGQLGDPRISKFVTIPAGTYFVGEASARIEAVTNEFDIGLFPVTNVEFDRFIRAQVYSKRIYWSEAGWKWLQSTGHKRPRFLSDTRWNQPSYPVIGISWFEAVAYCKWLSLESEVPIRLPTEVEWEIAARGTTSNLYPWGNEFVPSKLNCWEGTYVGRTSPVGIFSQGISPFGVYDMTGNVWEWCSTTWDSDPIGEYPPRYDEYGSNELEGDNMRIIRGGAWCNDRMGARATLRLGSFPSAREMFIGFRIVRQLGRQSD